MAFQLTSQQIHVTDATHAVDHFFEQGWTDGLPIVPPTPQRVEAMLAGARIENSSQEIGRIPARRRVVIAEKVAINAVMAGCLPSYAPVVFAAVEAMLAPEFNLHGASASTGGTGILTIVNGPLTTALDINATDNVFGPGHRANATIGRALRLVLMNVCGALPGTLDRSTFGHPGKFTYCIAEDESDPQWVPLHVERGRDPKSSAVTVFAGEGPHLVSNHAARTPEGILATIADQMRALGSFNMTGHGQMVVVLGPEHRRTMLAAGWEKDRMRSFLFDTAKRPRADLIRGGLIPGNVTEADEITWVRPVTEPEDILIATAGGRAGRYSVVIPGWSGHGDTVAVTKTVP